MSYSSLYEFYRLGVAETAVAHLAAEDQQDILDASQDVVDSFLRPAGYGVPIPTATVSRSIKRAECQIAAWDMLRCPGADPTTDADGAIKDAAEKAMEWLRDVAKGVVQPIPVTSSGTAADATPDVEEGGAAVVTEASRGWGYP